MITQPTTQLYIDRIFLLDPRHEPFLHGTPGRVYAYDIQGMAFLCVLLLIVGGLLLAFMLAFSGMEGATQAALERDGSTTSGTILERYVRQSTNNKGQPMAEQYFVVFQFTVNGEVYSENQEVSEAAYQKFEPGASIEVRYLPANPSITRIPGEVVYDSRPMLAIGTVLFGGGCVAGLMAIRARRRRAGLERFGQVLPGRITGSNRRFARGSGTIVNIDYTFVTPDGETLTGKSSAVRNDLWNQSPPPVNQDVAVLYVDKGLHTAL